VRNSQASVVRSQSTRVNNLPATVVVSNVQTQNGVLGVMSYFIEKDQKVYMFHGFTSSTLFDRMVPTFEQVMKSFDHLRNQAALTKQPQRVKIERVEQPGELRQILTRFGVKEANLEEIAIVNGMYLEDKLQRGDLVKVVR
jgi:predicted Zn-dependent protease